MRNPIGHPLPPWTNDNLARRALDGVDIFLEQHGSERFRIVGIEGAGVMSGMTIDTFEAKPGRSVISIELGGHIRQRVAVKYQAALLPGNDFSNIRRRRGRSALHLSR